MLYINHKKITALQSIFIWTTQIEILETSTWTFIYDFWNTYGIIQLFDAFDNCLIWKVQLIGCLYKSQAIATQFAEHFGHVAFTQFVHQNQTAVD